MKYLAVDYGLKRTGTAVSDPAGSMAFPLRVLALEGRERLVPALLALAEEERAEALVVGLPRRGNGEESDSSRRARNLAQALKESGTLPVYLVEEHLSSWDAETRLRQAGVSGKKAMARLDAAAAAAILESFLCLPPERHIPL